MSFGYRVYFADRTGNRVVRWDPDSGATAVVAGEPTDKSADQELNEPYGLAWDRDGNLLIADKFNNRICKLENGRLNPIVIRDADGHRRRRPESPRWYDPNLLETPSGIFAEAGGTILCAFHHDHTIYRIHLDGHLELVAGVPRSRRYQFCEPREFAPAPEVTDTPLQLPISAVSLPDGTLYFVERGYQILRELHPTRGLSCVFPLTKRQEFSRAARAPLDVELSQYHPAQPGNLALDAAGTLYMTDHQHACILQIDVTAGRVRRVVESQGNPESSARGISGLAFGSDGTAWILDAGAGALSGYDTAHGIPWKPLGVALTEIDGVALRLPSGGAGIVTGL